MKGYINVQKKILFSFLLILMSGSACHAQQYNLSKKHHTSNGFTNNYFQDRRGFTDFLKWQWERRSLSVEAVTFPLIKNDPEFLHQNRTKPTLTWIGHATFLIQFAGLNILTDPHFTLRASPISFAGPPRYTPPGLKLEQLPEIDIVIISHNHYDHLDKKTVTQLHAQQKNNPPRFFVPLGLQSWFAAQGISNVEELDWWNQTSFRDWAIHSVPVQHFSGRSLWDRNETLWTGWVLEHPQFRFFFAGDTGYSKDFLNIQKRFGTMDLSAIPIGAYKPRWFMRPMHVNPEEAVKIHQDLQSRYSVAMHWGTFILTDEAMTDPPQELKKALQNAQIAEDRFFVMKHGEVLSLNFLEK